AAQRQLAGGTVAGLFDPVDDFQQRLRAGLYYIGADAGTAIAATVMQYIEDGFALGVLAQGDGVDFKLLHRDRYAGGVRKRLVSRIHRPVTAPLVINGAPVAVLQSHGRGARHAGAV